MMLSLEKQLRHECVNEINKGKCIRMGEWEEYGQGKNILYDTIK